MSQLAPARSTHLLPRATAAEPVAGSVRGRIAVLQPYLFPYLGTFQLARQVERFVFFDDVAFIKKGHIHRNALLLDGQRHPFTMAVRHASQNRRIDEHEYVGDWASLLRLLHRAYADAPYFVPVFGVVQHALLDGDCHVARKNARCMAAVFNYLRLPFDGRFASAHALPAELRGSARVRAVCRAEGATMYVNPAGGRVLYDPADFRRDGIELRFCTPRALPYAQRAPAFVPDLSIIDVLMHNAPARVVEMLDACDLVA